MDDHDGLFTECIEPLLEISFLKTGHPIANSVVHRRIICLSYTRLYCMGAILAEYIEKHAPASL